MKVNKFTAKKCNALRNKMDVSSSTGRLCNRCRVVNAIFKPSNKVFIHKRTFVIIDEISIAEMRRNA